MQLSPRYNFRYPEITDQVSAFPPDVAAQNALLLDQVIGSLADNTAQALGQVTELEAELDTRVPSILAMRLDTTVGTRIFAGDTLIYGDTGWRFLSTDIMPTGGIYIRRINSTVYAFAGSGLWRTFTFSSTSPGNAEGVIPVGFRSDVYLNFIPVILDSDKTSVGMLQVLSDGLVSVRMSSGYTSVDQSLQSMNAHWMTAQPWPTVLPGTPA